MIENFFSNNWTIGILGGIISGIIVYAITDRIFSKRENKEYIQKLKLANNELLHNIRPMVVEETKPTINILNSIIKSTARRYSVKIEDLYNQQDIADELIKEIVANPFLTSENKLKYSALCLEVSDLKLQETPTKVQYISKGKDISKETMTLTLGLMTALTSTIFITLLKSDLTKVDFDFNQVLPILPLIILIPILSLTISKILQTLKQKKEKEIQTESFKKIIEKMRYFQESEKK